MDDLHRQQLRILRRQYFQLAEPSQLYWPTGETLKTATVQSWLFSNLFDKDKIPSPPLDRYQLRVLKLLISKLEQSITDPEEDVRLLFLHSGTFYSYMQHNLHCFTSLPNSPCGTLDLKQCAVSFDQSLTSCPFSCTGNIG